jgi:hypothetical protein
MKEYNRMQILSYIVDTYLHTYLYIFKNFLLIFERIVWATRGGGGERIGATQFLVPFQIRLNMKSKFSK